MANTRYNILFEDDWILVIDKPSGMLVIPTPKNEKNTLTDLINMELDSRGVSINAYPCHRLDRETSGLIIYAKGKKMQGLIMEQFKNRLVKKTYAAFVHGFVKNPQGVINKPIFSNNKKKYLDAITHYKVIKRNNAFSVLEVMPVTGRTNQIRIHFKGIAHPLVGESVYIFRKDFALKFKRVALHAKNIVFQHPVTGKKLDLSSPLPKDMEEFLLFRS